MSEYLKKAVKKSSKPKARRTMLYGVHGIGKSTWASQWPSPVFINAEDGVGDLDVMAFPVPVELEDVKRPIMELAAADPKSHPYKTLVIDSIDWIEKLIHQKVVSDSSVPVGSVGEIPYGKGYETALGIFQKLLGALEAVRENGIHILFLAHASIQRFESPELDSYDRYQPKLHTNSKGIGAGALVQEFCDEVLFANYRVFQSKSDSGFNRKRNMAKGSGERVIYTAERPTHLAKSRLDLPFEIEMAKDEFSYGKYLK